jgi:hypothetical protein
MLVPMPKIMLKVVALILDRVKGFVVSRPGHLSPGLSQNRT